MILYPPLSSPRYSQRQLRNPDLTPAQRKRRRRKSFKLKQRRHDALLNCFTSPGAVFAARLGLIPPHLQHPMTRNEMRNYIDEANSAFFFSVSADRRECLDVINGTPEVVPPIPRKLRAPKACNLPPLTQENLTRLPNGHVVCLPALCQWFLFGQSRFFTRVLQERSVKRANGEWSIMFPYEMRRAFPSISFEGRNYRKWYLVQCLRNEAGEIIGVGVYSATYAPLFSLEIELENSSALPEPIRDWWTDPSPRLPPYQGEIDLDDPAIKAEIESASQKSHQKMAAYVERLSRERELRL